MGTLNLFNSGNITGELSSLNKNMAGLILNDNPYITGNLSDISGISHFLGLLNMPNISGDLASLEGNINHALILVNCPNVTGVYTPTQGIEYDNSISDSPVDDGLCFIFSDTGQTDAEIKQSIINIADSIRPDSTTSRNGYLYAVLEDQTGIGDSIAKLMDYDWFINIEFTNLTPPSVESIENI